MVFLQAAMSRTNLPLCSDIFDSVDSGLSNTRLVRLSVELTQLRPLSVVTLLPLGGATDRHIGGPLPQRTWAFVAQQIHHTNNHRKTFTNTHTQSRHSWLPLAATRWSHYCTSTFAFITVKVTVGQPLDFLMNCSKYISKSCSYEITC